MPLRLLARIVSRLLFLATASLLLGACAVEAPLTYGQVHATATVSGCWPARYATPVPRLVRDAEGQVVAETPLPLCAPLPGETRTPLPTRIPPPEPYPTMRPEQPFHTAGRQLTFHLPGRAYALDLAVHPTENWPAVAVMHRQSMLQEPIQLFVRVYDPTGQRWNTAQQVDLGESSAGQDRNGSIQLAITGDRAVHAIWGASDEDGGIWHSQSGDSGQIWSAPVRIASECTSVQDAAATVDGQLAVLAICGRLPTHPTLIVRRADGSWQPPHTFDAVPASFGALVLSGDGPTAHLAAIATAHGDGQPVETVALIHGELATQDWQITTRDIAVSGSYYYRHRALAFTRTFTATDGTTSAEQDVVFAWKGQYSPSLYALLSRDGGRSFGPVQSIVGGAHFSGRAEASDQEPAFVAPAYDPTHDRLAAIWTCCGDHQQAQPATHYASSSPVGVDAWQPTAPEGAIPLVLGSRSAGDTATAQAPNSGDVWVAWVEQLKRIEVRSAPASALIQEVVQP
jgi:hypothetical protein